MIDRDNLRERRGIHTVTDLHATLPADHRIFPNEAIPADLDPRMRHVSKIVDMQYCSMHHDRSRSDLDPAWAGMEIDPFIQIHAVTEPDMIGKPQADAALDRGSAIHTQDQTVEYASQSHTDNCGNPSEQKVQRLFENISRDGRCLAIQVETDLTEHDLRSRLRIPEICYRLLQSFFQSQGRSPA